MDRMKTFFIYFILVVLFFIFSQIMIYIGINTTYNSKDIHIKTPLQMNIEVKATSINGFAKGKIHNNLEADIENKYLKLSFYSKNDVLMGTKYIEIDNLKANEEKDFEIRFNYNKVNRAVVEIVDDIENNSNIEENKQSDPNMGVATMISALILLYFI